MNSDLIKVILISHILEMLYAGYHKKDNSHVRWW
jgi:hypothetical protein